MKKDLRFVNPFFVSAKLNGWLLNMLLSA